MNTSEFIPIYKDDKMLLNLHKHIESSITLTDNYALYSYFNVFKPIDVQSYIKYKNIKSLIVMSDIFNKLMIFAGKFNNYNMPIMEQLENANLSTISDIYKLFGINDDKQIYMYKKWHSKKILNIDINLITKDINDQIDLISWKDIGKIIESELSKEKKLTIDISNYKPNKGYKFYTNYYNHNNYSDYNVDPEILSLIAFCYNQYDKVLDVYRVRLGI